MNHRRHKKAFRKLIRGRDLTRLESNALWRVRGFWLSEILIGREQISYERWQRFWVDAICRKMSVPRVIFH